MFILFFYECECTVP